LIRQNRLPGDLGKPESVSNFRPFGQCQGVIHVDAQVANRVLNVGMTQQDLDGAKITRRLVD